MNATLVTPSAILPPKMRVVIADDEPLARQVLREHLEAIPSVEIVGEASTGTEAAQCVLDLNPDLLFLDQQMPEMDGLSVARYLRGRLPMVVFVTAFEEHALDAFDVGAVDYLLKPVRHERLERALEKARRQWQPGPIRTETQKGAPAPTASVPVTQAKLSLNKISARRGSDIYLLDPTEIIAFQAEGEIVHIIAVVGGVQQRYLAEGTLKALEADPALASFRRVHRSTLINSDHIRKISPLSSRRWLLQMSNGFEAIVSKRLAKALRE